MCRGISTVVLWLIRCLIGRVVTNNLGIVIVETDREKEAFSLLYDVCLSCLQNLIPYFLTWWRIDVIASENCL